MERKEIYKRLVELHEKKDTHLEQMKEYFEMLATTKSTMTFMTGSCSDCDAIEEEIQELENQLKTKYEKDNN